MKTYFKYIIHLVLFLVSIIALTSLKPLSKSTPDTAEEILQKMVDKLKSARSIQYDYQRFYSTGEQQNILKASSYLDFSSPDTVIHFRYQHSNKELMSVFNGSEYFFLDKKAKTMRIKGQPVYSDHSSLSYFYDSPVSIRYGLPPVIADKSIAKKITDTTIGNTSFYVVHFQLFKKIIGYLGGYDSISENRTFFYAITIDRNNFMPVHIARRNNVDQHHSVTSFTNFALNGPVPHEESWYYSTYETIYTKLKPEIINTIQAGTIAPDWELPLFETDKKIRLKQYNGKLVMLEFWIRNCQPCIKSVPQLNQLQEKFANTDFRLLSINNSDPKEVIRSFKEKYGVKYPILYEGAPISKMYGIDGYPAVVLIGKDGKVIFAGHAEESILEEMIRRNL